MKKIACTLSAALLLSACAVGPDYARPDVAVHDQWAGEIPIGASQVIEPDWWRSFDSAELDALIAQALAQNLDLRAALHRVEQARANVRVAGAPLLPAVGATAGASRTYTDPAVGPSGSQNNFRGGLGVSYELDLFGGNIATLGGAEANLLASQYARDALALVVVGDVAGAYFNVLNLRERVRIGRNNLDNTGEVLRIVEARRDAGAASDLEVAQQRSTLANSEATLATLERQLANAENALAILLGQPPQTVELAGDSLRTVTIPAIEPAQPSTLLERRPDIRSAEAGLIAANADINVARAAFFPSVNLGVDAAIAAATLSGPAGTTLALASSLTAPIFQGGRLQGNLERTQARQAELVENYRGAILNAFREVEDALAAARAARLREQALERALVESRRSYDLSRELYEAGTIDFQTFLDSQRTLLQTEDTYATVRLEMLAAAIDLYLAMGGGWLESQGTHP